MIRVLLAEDQAMVLGALSALLGLESDIEVGGAAADGETAWRDVQRLKPDVLVTDIEMPGLTGLELAQRIQRHEMTTKVVIVTTFARPGFLRPPRIWPKPCARCIAVVVPSIHNWRSMPGRKPIP